MAASERRRFCATALLAVLTLTALFARADAAAVVGGVKQEVDVAPAAVAGEPAVVVSGGKETDVEEETESAAKETAAEEKAAADEKAAAAAAKAKEEEEEAAIAAAKAKEEEEEEAAKKNSGLSTGIIVAIALGAVVATGVPLLLCCFCGCCSCINLDWLQNREDVDINGVVLGKGKNARSSGRSVDCRNSECGSFHVIDSLDDDELSDSC